jgi:uncharacterized protein YkwD
MRIVPPLMRSETQNTLTRFTLLVALAVAALALPAGINGALAGDVTRCGRIGQAPRAATLHQLRTSVLCLVNRAREHRGIAHLRYSAELRRAATGHSNDMVSHSHFSHSGSGGSSVTARVARAGYLARAGAYAIGENIGGGPGRRLGSPVAVFRAWMHSPGHRANILDRRFRDFGVGVVRGFPFGGGRRAATYTLDFGSRRS